MRPVRYSHIQTLSFSYITNDLYKIAEFAQHTVSIGEMCLGNRGYKLFQDEMLLDQIKGTELAPDVMATVEDRANLKALVELMQKTRTLRLDRLSRTWPVLKLLLDNSSAF